MRPQDWPEKLHDLIEQRRHASFRWGSNDCCMFASDVALAMCGRDMAADYRGKYSSALGARRLLGAGGVAGAMAKASVQVEFPEIPVMCAQRGDVVMYDSERGGDALGICLGMYCAFTGPDGITFISLRYCRKAWRVE